MISQDAAEQTRASRVYVQLLVDREGGPFFAVVYRKDNCQRASNLLKPQGQCCPTEAWPATNCTVSPVGKVSNCY